MTELEARLASIFAALATARQERDVLRIAHLMQRREAICATLSAPEQAISAPEAQEQSSTKHPLAA